MNEPLTTNKLIGIMAGLCDAHGFLSGIILDLEVHACREYQGREVRTAATNGTYLLFNPDFAATLTLAEIKGVCLHEVWHVAGGHPWRGIGYDNQKVNIAQDHEVNNICLEAGATLPQDRVCDIKYKNWSFERIYEDLYGHEDPSEDQPDEPGEQDEQDEQDEGSEQDEAEESQSNESPGDTGSESEEQSSRGEEGNGSESVVPPVSRDSIPDSDTDSSEGASGDNDEPDEEEQPAPWGEVWDATNEDGSPLTEEQRQDALGKLAEEIVRGQTHQIESGQQDSYGGNATLDRSIKTNAPWTKVIRKILTRKGKFTSSTYRRPSRRSMTLGTLSPYRLKSGIPEAVIAVDISWSVDMVRLRAFFDHLDQLRKEIRIDKIHVLPFNFNAQADSVVVVKHGESLPREFEVGGGTRFAPVFDWQRRYAKQAKIVIVFTDLGDNDYGVKPKCPVVWASSDPISNRNRPPFGTAVEIDTTRRSY